ncbi:MAG: hypothetical protein AAGI68_12225 [Planctomycetota bacterium]
MPRFRVYGADAETGNDADQVITADTADEAEVLARHRGLLISRTVEIEEASAPAHGSDPPDRFANYPNVLDTATLQSQPKVVAKSTPVKKPEESPLRVLAGAVVIIVVLVWGISSCVSCMKPEDPAERRAREEAERNAWKTEVDKLGAYTAAQNVLERDMLISPATADYQTTYSRATTYLGNHQYTVRLVVDSQNAFGAVVRNRFTAQVTRYGEDDWRVNITADP